VLIPQVLPSGLRMTMRNSAVWLVPDVLLLLILSALKMASFDVLTAVWLRKQIFLGCDVV
jgi:hypothetical protein